MKNLILISLLAVLLYACGGGSSSSSSPTIVETPVVTPVTYSTMREATEAKSGIYVGSLYNDSYMQHDTNSSIYQEALSSNFNMMSLEWSIAMEEIWTNENTIDFTRHDVAFDYARTNNMAVRVTHLLWYSTIPSWLENGVYTNAEVETLIEWYITQVITHYKANYPDVYTEWNVVNETITDTSPSNLRNGFLVNKLGSDYIAKAFQWADAADNTAKLYIVDYGCLGAGSVNNAKSTKLLSIMNDLVSRGIHIDGIGFQGHFSLSEYDNIEEIKTDFAQFATLNLELQFTELDILINNDVTGTSATKEEAQATFFKDIYQLCVDTPQCTAVSLWGLADHLSYVNTGWAPWLSQTEDWPLLIDENMQMKDVYDELVDILSTQ
ncbi:MAG: hypothetical protein C0603_03960 [Denitrovibrio sp.]|nr:MAG: hypothetical protein C0603_03960 [Denitrovibrio sp.]